MTREEIERRIRKIDEIIARRTQKGPLESYNSGKIVHKKQLKFHKSKKRNRWVFGGNRTGKTECGAVETVWLARGSHPFKPNKPNTTGWVVSLSFQVQRDVAQQKILHYLNPDWIAEVVMLEGRKGSPASGIIDYIMIKNVFGGLSKIAFKSCDQGREKFQGASLDYVWFDEEPPKDIYDECRMRVLDKRGEIFGTMTPLKGLTWVYDQIYLNPRSDKEIWCQFMDWSDNPYLDKEEVQMLKSAMSESELRSRCFGRFQVNGGAVYDEFDESIHVIEPFDVPLDWFDMISIDPGLNNPLSAHWYARDFDGNVFVIAEHYEARQTVEYHATKIREMCRRLRWPANSSGNFEALIDSAANQRTLASEKTVSELFSDNGIAVNSRVNKDLFTGINRVKSYLKPIDGRPKLYIFKTCVNLIRELKGYYWGSGEAPLKKDDHALDELRYYIMHVAPATKFPMSIFARHRKRMRLQ